MVKHISSDVEPSAKYLSKYPWRDSGVHTSGTWGIFFVLPQTNLRHVHFLPNINH